MNYFELFGLPIGFQVDTQKLRAAFMEIQKATHPDKFVQGNPEEQETALEQSALANKGYTLLNQKERILPYVLEILGILTPDEKYALEPDFLMEMMDVNETMMDLEFDPDAIKLEGLKAQVDLFEQSLDKELTELTTAFDTANKEAQITLLKAIKDVYYRNKYLYRIKQSLARITA